MSMATPLTYQQIDEEVIRTLAPVTGRYRIALGISAFLAAMMFLAWLLQVMYGMGLTGLNVPVSWGCYIVDFVFWVGIGHAGTLISAFLYLFRVPWRTAVYRVAETMTVFAVMTAGLFPLIHLGRAWVFYWTMPIPNRAHLYPNFKSPLVWDVLAISTYLTISSLFWYLGLLPDLAAVRDNSHGVKRRFYRYLALGWHNRWEQWRHYTRAYLGFACLAAPLVLSVHTVVSFDFSMSVVPGWHSTIFPPFFVIGAIHSGLAMVLLLVIPGHRLLKLQKLIGMRHFEGLAQLLLFTTTFMAYSYGMELFMAWYTGDIFERSQFLYRMTGHYAWAFWGMILFNGVVPFALASRRIRTSQRWLLVISLLILIGMWLERFVIVVPSLAHDFLPNAWGIYKPQPIELVITVGSFGFFFTLFLACIRLLPAMAMSEMKEEDVHHRLEAAR
ncbi:MAG: polysulfide reductase NrfD [Armatimonadetes bacterium]|nr:polysulfide reductase NrfD [Armatimonadota bacterium]